MKNTLFYRNHWKIYFLVFLVFIILSYSCKEINKNSYYYSGNKKIELIISGDTLGILLKDTTINPADTNLTSIDKIRKLAQSTLAKQGYDTAGFLSDKGFVSDKIKLIISKQNNKTRKILEDEARSLKNAANTPFVYNSGYLVRIKKTNKPLILTDEIIIKFKPGTTQTQITNIFDKFKLTIRRKNPFTKLQYTVATNNNSPFDVLRITQYLKEKSYIQYAQPNFIYIKKINSVDPDDTYYINQWPLHDTDENTCEDADIDADLAWEFTTGNNNTIIGVVDVGFDVQHEDLKNIFSRNSLDLPGNNDDEDGNGFLNDTIGWNFVNNSNNLDGGPHGTAITGIIAAEGNNAKGITGVCPGCRILPVRTDHSLDTDRDALSIGYAESRGAKIINCSWEYNGMDVPDNVVDAINEATSRGVVVICSATNSEANYCSDIIDLTSLPNTIAVSRSTNSDMYDKAGWGDCVDLLAPTAAENISGGLLRIFTTDATGSDGFSTGTRDFYCSNVISSDYTACFYGTSSSAAFTSGVAGLILSANSSLNKEQVQFLLQDCADKIENSQADYSFQNGKSLKETHGFGRLNAYEAVKIASDKLEKGGRDGVDIFVRDNELDWGNTEKPSNYLFEPVRGFIPQWKSMDIKVDAPPYETIPPVLNNDFFERLPNENPIGGEINKVYVRVRNRGFRNASSVTVKLNWVHAGASLPPLPSDFWDRFPADPAIASEWNSLGTQSIFNLAYSGASVANSGRDAAEIVSFNFNAPVHDPTTPNHYCLMALVSSPNDMMPTEALKTDPERLNMDYVTSHFNNATHRNYNILEGEEEADAIQQFYLYNPYNYPIFTKLDVLSGEKIPVIFEDTTITSSVHLGVGEKKLITFKLNLSGLQDKSVLTIQQLLIDEQKKILKILGGISYEVRTNK